MSVLTILRNSTVINIMTQKEVKMKRQEIVNQLNDSYIIKRNKLIPDAVLYANNKHGTGTRGNESNEWTKTYLREMDRLARVHGLIGGKCPLCGIKKAVGVL